MRTRQSVLIFLFVFLSGADFMLHRLDWKEFLTSPEWYPTSVTNKRYGTLALFAGTVSVTLLAMLIAVPFGLGTAVFISEFTRGAVCSRSLSSMRYVQMVSPVAGSMATMLRRIPAVP